MFPDVKNQDSGAVPQNPSVSLTWNDVRAIAHALHEFWPLADQTRLTPEDARRMVVGLPTFADVPHPENDNTLDAIVHAWIRLEDEGEETGQFDADE